MKTLGSFLAFLAVLLVTATAVHAQATQPGEILPGPSPEQIKEMQRYAEEEKQRQKAEYEQQLAKAIARGKDIKLSLILDTESVTAMADTEQRIAEFEAAMDANQTWRNKWRMLENAVRKAKLKENPDALIPVIRAPGQLVSREEAIKKIGPAPAAVPKPTRPLMPGISLRFENTSDEVRRVYPKDHYELNFSGPGKRSIKNYSFGTWIRTSDRESFIDILPGDAYETRLNRPEQELPFFVVKSGPVKIDLTFYSGEKRKSPGVIGFPKSLSDDAAVIVAEPKELQVQLK